MLLRLPRRLREHGYACFFLIDGFWGRLAIFEMPNFNDRQRDALMTTETMHDIRRAVGKWTCQSLLENCR